MKKKILISLLVLAALSAGAAIVYHVIYADAQRLPDNNPRSFLARGAQARQGAVVVCAGDSITHGRVSINYVDILSQRLSSRGFTLVNAGINSELAYNLGQRLDEIIKCDPDVVTVLIGSNDANATLSESALERSLDEMRLPRNPDSRWFRSNLEAICTRLKSETRARIALLSLPPMGEEPGSDAYRRAAEYSRIIREIAAAQRVDYLPLNEVMTRGIEARGKMPEILFRGDPEFVMYRALARHYLLRESYDDISESYGFLYLTDLLHLNTRGASAVADLIEEYVMRTDTGRRP
jgi:lysophospholipase L1-like esterase